MSDYLKPPVALKTIEGSVAKVEIYPEYVLWTPTSSRTIPELDEKVRLQNEFNQVTHGIPNLVSLPVTIVDTQKHIYKQPRAKGFNLEGSEGEVQGGGFVDFYTKLSLPKRIIAFNTYVSVLSRIHDSKRLFNDHKPDSIFIDPVLGMSIVDTDKLSSCSNSTTAWKQEVDLNSSALEMVLKSFFTRNKLTSRYIPNLYSENISTMGGLLNAGQLLETINFMVNDGPNQPPHNRLMANMVNEALNQLGLEPIDFQKTQDLQYVDLKPIQSDMDELRLAFPNYGFNTSTAEIIAHMQLLRQRQDYLAQKDKLEYSAKLF